MSGPLMNANPGWEAIPHFVDYRGVTFGINDGHEGLAS
jgi:hypothetical protein